MSDDLNERVEKLEADVLVLAATVKEIIEAEEKSGTLMVRLHKIIEKINGSIEPRAVAAVKTDDDKDPK